MSGGTGGIGDGTRADGAASGPLSDGTCGIGVDSGAVGGGSCSMSVGTGGIGDGANMFDGASGSMSGATGGIGVDSGADMFEGGNAEPVVGVHPILEGERVQSSEYLGQTIPSLPQPAPPREESVPIR